MNQKLNSSYLPGIVDRLEEDKAIIITEDGQQLIWPIDLLPDGTVEGMAIRLTLKISGNDSEENETTAKAVLKEILNTNNGS